MFLLIPLTHVGAETKIASDPVKKSIPFTIKIKVQIKKSSEMSPSIIMRPMNQLAKKELD